MTPRLLPLFAGLVWIGATLALSGHRWVRRPPLPARLEPYGPTGTARRETSTSRSPTAGWWRPAIEPLAARVGPRLVAAMGSGDHLERRLAQAGTTVDPVAFRTRQAGGAVAAVLAAGAAAAALGVPLVPSAVVVAAAGGAAFLRAEQRLGDAVTARHEQLRLELPVVAEQLGMLLGAGWSLGGAMNRIAVRGQGVAADDLATVCARIRQGLSEGAALHEWAARTDLVPLDRLVSVLSLDRHTSDVGRLIAEEARSMRRDAHRQLLETIERRSQAVWIPVTVAALVPGVIFLAVPFVDALRHFTAA